MKLLTYTCLKCLNICYWNDLVQDKKTKILCCPECGHDDLIEEEDSE